MKNIYELESIETRKFNKGDIVRDFKNRLYLIEGIAEYIEKGEKVFVYRKLYDDFSLYVTSLETFLEEVDYKEYPNVKQKYRFEKIPYVELCSLNFYDLKTVVNYISNNGIKVNID